MKSRPVLDPARTESPRRRPIPSRSPAHAFVLALALLPALAGSGPLGCARSIGSSPFLPADHPDAQAFVAAHNRARATISPEPKAPLPPLRWSPTLAAQATKTAARCDFVHSTSDFGENLFARTSPHPPDDAVEVWLAERDDWDPESGSCRPGRVCTHYTQLVWRGSRELGCATRRCERGSPMGAGPWFLTVCNYAPAGNVSGVAPY